MDIAQEMRKSLDREIEKTLFASFWQCNTEAREVNPIYEIYRMRDKMTTVILCNPDEQEQLKAVAEKESGFWEIIGTTYIEKGQAVIVKDENLKMSILQGRRNNGTTHTPNHATIA